MASEGRNGDPAPFSTDELMNFNGEWSLLHDMRLLSNLKSLSGAIFDRADHVMAALDDIVYKTEEKCVKVSNVVNDLQMLANNQFIENRVYEESEEAIAAPVSEPTGGDDNQQDATSKLKSSLNEGLEFIRRILPDVQIEDDSDEEDNIRQALDSCQRENKFLIKKLPPIIGGPEYIRENFVSLFGSRDTSDAIDAMDVFAQNDSSKESDEEHHSEEDIVISSSESEDMFMQPENKLPDAANPKLDNLFSDSSSPEVDALSNSKPKMALSFQDELNRRLLGNKPDSNSSKSDVSTTIAQNSGNVNNLIREQKQNISSDDSGSSASASGFRDRLSNLFANSDESPVPPASKPKPNPQGQIMSDSRQYSAAVANPASAPRKPLDFLSDDDDDEFNIFKTKLSAKEKQKERVSKLFESSDSGSDEAERRDRKGLPAKDSVSRQEPEKEVSDARRSETRHAAQSVQAPAREPLPLNPTASLFSNDDQSSDDDLFTSRVVQLSTPHRTSINSNTKSQVREVSGAIPVSPASTSGPHPANNSDSESSEEMNRSAIANKLEKTIFGNQSRKPVGGISLFGNASSEKKPAKPVSQNMEDISPAAVLPSALETKAGSEIESAVSVRRKSSPKSSDDDMLPATVLKRSVPLSSHVVKSRPKVRNRRRPTRAALKSPSNETDYAMGQSSPDEAARTQLPSEKAVESGSVAESGVVVTDPEAAVSEARKAGSIKSDEKESSRTEPEKKQIPHSGTHQLEAGNLIMNSDPDSQRSNESSKTVSTPITGTKSILSDDSDEELFAATPRRAASNATAAAAKQTPTTAAAIKQTTKKKALFSDSEDDEIFATTTKKTVSSTNNSSVKANQSLFDSSGEESNPLKTDDRMTVKATQNEKSGAKPVTTKADEDKKKKETKQSSLFSDSDDDDLFTSKHK